MSLLGQPWLLAGQDGHSIVQQVWKPQAGMEIACDSAAHPRAVSPPGKELLHHRQEIFPIIPRLDGD